MKKIELRVNHFTHSLIIQIPNDKPYVRYEWFGTYRYYSKRIRIVYYEEDYIVS